jgi:hypothetical protein
MSGEKNMRKVEAHVPHAMWEEFEKWAEDRGPVPTRYLMIAMLRLFLAAPEGVKLLALYGRSDQLARAAEFREDFLAPGILDAALADEAGLLEAKASPGEVRKGSGKKRGRKTG